MLSNLNLSLNLLLPLTLLSLLHTTTAHPTKPIPELKCHCISTPPSAREMFDSPTTVNACRDYDAQGRGHHDWQHAHHYATQHALPIHFTPQTISQVLRSEEPVPTSILLRLSQSKREGSAWQGGSRIVCAVREEKVDVGKWEGKRKGDHEAGKQCDGFVVKVVLLIVLMVVVYEAGSVVFRSIRRLFFSSSESSVRLQGAEKSLKWKDVEACDDGGYESDAKKKTLSSRLSRLNVQ